MIVIIIIIIIIIIVFRIFSCCVKGLWIGISTGVFLQVGMPHDDSHFTSVKFSKYKQLFPAYCCFRDRLATSRPTSFLKVM